MCTCTDDVFYTYSYLFIYVYFQAYKSMYTCDEICLYLSNTGADFLRISDPWQLVQINVLKKNMRGNQIRAGSLSHDFPVEAHIHSRCKQTIPSFLL